MRRMARRGWSCVAAALFAVAGCSLVLARPTDEWQAPELRDHPLVGTIWDAASGESIRVDTLLERLSASTFVLLGDKHDNPDHHRLQARILSGLVARGRRPAVAFEPMTVDRSEALARVLASTSPTPERVIDAVARPDQGWPWPLYEPVIAEALRAGLPLVAADLDPAWVAALQKRGIAGLDPRLRARLDLVDVPLPPAGRARLADEIRQSHCGHATGAMVEHMVEAQRARDAHLARALVDHATDGAVLIAGNGHVQRGIGVPLYLARWAPDASVTSVGLLEVSPDEKTASEAIAAEGEGVIPFDYVWFTPRMDLVDPCERFREQLRQMRSRDAEGAR
jgi:uncharacterized iron-regulated protein